MRGSLLRLVSTVLVMVVCGLSTARAICASPCLSEPAAAASASNHCEPPSSGDATAIDAHIGACDACRDAGLDDVDRLSERHRLAAWLATSADVSMVHVFAATLGPVPDSGSPPGLRVSAAFSVPLRI